MWNAFLMGDLGGHELGLFLCEEEVVDVGVQNGTHLPVDPEEADGLLQDRLPEPV